MKDNCISVKFDVSVKNDLKVFNGLNTMCVWNALQFDNEHVGEEPDGFIKKLYPYLEYLVMMTFTGGRDYNNWYKEDKNGEPLYDFSKPIKILKNVLRGGVRPFIVIGQTPYDLSTNPTDKGDLGTPWGNRNGPKDFNRYYDYIKTFAHKLKQTFGLEEISQWKFRLMTEWDDCLDVKYWWNETLEDYFKLYDYTLAALSSEIGEENLFYGPGNVKELERIDFILEHCANDINYYTGKKGTKCDHISVSSYFENVNPEAMTEIIRKLQYRVEQYPMLNIREIGFGEVGFGNDYLGNRLIAAQGITEEYGSAVARIFDITIL